MNSFVGRYEKSTSAAGAKAKEADSGYNCELRLSNHKYCQDQTSFTFSLNIS